MNKKKSKLKKNKTKLTNKQKMWIKFMNKKIVRERCSNFLKKNKCGNQNNVNEVF